MFPEVDHDQFYKRGVQQMRYFMEDGYFHVTVWTSDPWCPFTTSLKPYWSRAWIGEDWGSWQFKGMHNPLAFLYVEAMHEEMCRREGNGMVD
jgi:hypothetical protein